MKSFVSGKLKIEMTVDPKRMCTNIMQEHIGKDSATLLDLKQHSFGLLRVSRSVSNEALSVFYKWAYFLFETGHIIRKFLSTMGNSSKHITSVAIAWKFDAGTRSYFAELIKELGIAYPDLKHLELFFPSLLNEPTDGIAGLKPMLKDYRQEIDTLSELKIRRFIFIAPLPKYIAHFKPGLRGDSMIEIILQREMERIVNDRIQGGEMEAVTH